MPDHAAHCCAAGGADAAAAGQDRTGDRTDSGAHGRVLVASRHVAATAHRRQRADRDGNDCDFLDCFHDESPCKK